VRGPTARALAQQQLGQPQVLRGRDLQVLARRRHEPHLTAQALDQRRVVGRGRDDLRVRGQRPLEHVAAEDLRGLHRPQARAVERPDHHLAMGLLDRVGDGAAAIAASQSSEARVSRQSCTSSGVTSGRAASWTTDHVGLGRVAQRRADRVRALLAAGHPVGARRRHDARRQRDDDALDVRAGLQRGDAPLQERAPRTRDERLGPLRPKAFATAGGHEQRDRHRRLTG
jgi:hypothetical protein